MATVTMPLGGGGRRIYMPRRCVVCGERDCRLQETSFSISWTVGRTTYTRTLSTKAPLCDDHWDHFYSHQRTTWIFALVVALFAIVAAGIGGGLNVPWALGIGIGGAILSAIAWCVYGIVAWFSLVHASDINEHELTLTNVHVKFARAVEKGDDEDDEDEDEDEDDRYDARRRRRSRRADDDEDEDERHDARQRRRSRYADEDEDDRYDARQRRRSRRDDDDEDDEPRGKRRGRT